jgi:hypothetical protein
MTRQCIFRKIGIVGAIILLPAWLYLGYLESVYVTWPSQPQPEMRRSVPYIVEGSEFISPRMTSNRTVNYCKMDHHWVRNHLDVGLIFSGEFRFS